MKWLFVFLFCSWHIHAGTTIRGELHGKTLYWENVIAKSSAQMVPSFWQHTSNLPPTASWLPGGLATLPGNNITLQNGSERVVLPITFLGFEYNTGSQIPTQGAPWSGQVCTNNTHSGQLVTVAGGVECFLNYRLDYVTEITPFTFIRPVFFIDEQDVKDAFTGKAAGRYVGYLALESVYQFQYNQVESRQYLNHQFGVEIDHEPSIISNVTVTGSNELTTHYDLPAQQVSASSTFNITASGYFTNGLTVSLMNHRVDYLLYGPNLTEIPYSVDCIGCQLKNLVNEGKVANLTTHVAATNSPSVNFDVQIYFNSHDLSLLEEGQYSDTITLILAPDL